MNAMLARWILTPLLIPVSLSGAALEAAAQQPAVSGNHLRSATQQQPVFNYRLRLLGVYDATTGDPVAGAKVSDMHSRASSLTSNTGTVSLVFLPDGGALVRVEKLGYEPRTMAVAISPGDTVPLTLAMRRITTLPTIVTSAVAPYISPAMRGFQDRKKEGLGYFVDAKMLRKSEGQPLANVLKARMPSMNIYYGPHSATYLVQSPLCTKGAPPQVFLDGVPLGGAAPPQGSTATTATTPADLSDFLASDLEGAEWYPTSEIAPIEFGGTSLRCGVLLLWTRE